MPRAAFALVVVLWLVSEGCAQDLHFWGEELGPIFEVLAKDNLSGFVELSQEYDPTRLPSLPHFRTITMTKNSPVQNLKGVVGNVPGMHVRRRQGRTVLIKQKGVPDDILEIRISHLELKDNCFHDIYNANTALKVILQTPEVTAYALTHGLRVSPSGQGGGIGRGSGCGLPPPGTPHFSASMSDVTVSQALERVFQAFPGEILVYWNFPKGRDKSQRKEPQQMFRSFHSECHQVSSEDPMSGPPLSLLDPLCLPPAAFSAFPIWLLMQFDAPPQPPQRRVFLWFFSRKPFGNKTLITSG